nr:hypothetical protein [Tanacetum cinerariifolium]
IGSPLNLAEVDLILGDLKFISKGEEDELIRMKIPNELITDAIRNAPYYEVYLEIVAKHDRKLAAKEAKKQPKPAPAKKPSKDTLNDKVVKKVRKGKSTLKLVDEDEEVQPDPKPRSKGDDRDLEIALQLSLDEFQGQGRVSVRGVSILEPIAESIQQPPTVKSKAIIYLKVHESLKFLADEEVILEDPHSSSETLSSMKNLDDAFTFGDQFVNDKLTEDEPGKSNVEAEVVSMSFVATTDTTITTFPLPPPPPLQQSALSVELLSQLHDLLHKINETVNEAVKEAVNVALQAPLRKQFRDLPEDDIKEMLHQRMFEIGSYKSKPEHVTLYKALEASMGRNNREEFFESKRESRKRRRKDQDPPPPPTKDTNQSKRSRYDSDASGSTQALDPQPSAWKTSNTKEAPSGSYQQKSVIHSEQPVNEINPRSDWLKHVPEEDRPKTPQPDWVIPPNDLPEPENN